MTVYEDLMWRGLIQEISSPELIDKLNKGGMTFYIGTDPTANSGTTDPIHCAFHPV